MHNDTCSWLLIVVLFLWCGWPAKPLYLEPYIESNLCLNHATCVGVSLRAQALNMDEELREIKKVLARLSSTDDQLEDATHRLARLLYKSSSGGPLHRLQQQAIDLSLGKTLLGIMGSSSNPALLSRSAWCLALLVHSNDEARVRLGEMGAVPLLIDLLSPRSVCGSGKCWHGDWVLVYSQAVVALRKLTYHNQDNQQQFAVIGGIKLIVALANDPDLLTNYRQFPREAGSELESLVLNQTFVSRVQSVADVQKADILSCFTAFTHTEAIQPFYYPAYHVDLFTSDDTSVSDILLERGVVWPADTPPDSTPKVTRVCVTGVEDGGHCWCQFLSDREKLVSETLTASLIQIGDPPVQATPLFILGDVYAAYVECLGGGAGQWVRARLLAMEVAKNGKVTVLAVDYGVTITISREHLTELPPGCRGIPPQAIPCQLVGVQPPPASTALLENIAAVMRNMAFELLIFRKEIINFDGTETLLKLCQCPHKPTMIQALGALLNLSVSDELREEIGRRGAVHTLLELCRANLDAEVMQQVVCCLYNLVPHCHSNVSLLLEKGGDRVFADLLSTDSLSPKVRHCLTKLAQSVATQTSGGCVVNPTPLAWTARQDCVMRMRVNSERRHTHPVYHVLDSDTSDCEGVELIPVDTSHLMSVSQTKSYLINKQLPVCSEESTTHSFVMVECVDELPSSLVRRTLCAFINTGRECTMHIGVDKGGVVRGVRVQRKERDLLALAVDGLLSNFTPAIPHSQYTVSFVSVVGKGQRCLEDVFVVELMVKESLCHQVYSVQEKNQQGELTNRCYFRMGPFNEQLSFQEMRDMVAREEVAQYNSEVATLTENIQRLSTAIKTHSH